jgi:hypothetical protein
VTQQAILPHCLVRTGIEVQCVVVGMEPDTWLYSYCSILSGTRWYHLCFPLQVHTFPQGRCGNCLSTIHSPSFLTRGGLVSKTKMCVHLEMNEWMLASPFLCLCRASDMVGKEAGTARPVVCSAEAGSSFVYSVCPSPDTVHAVGIQL